MTTTSDKELLELAAKAAGWNEFDWLGDYNYMDVYDDDGHQSCWNPLTDDGDALRLAVKLDLLVDCCGACARPLPDSIGWQDGSELRNADPYAATRRAIVRAAAKIGESM